MERGVVINQRYRLARRLGDGAFGEVYEAHDLVLGGRSVAIKLLRREMSAHPEVVARFENEAIALSRVSHPNIVSVIDRGVFEGWRFLVTELAAGRTLEAWIGEHRAARRLIELGQVKVVFDQICAAVEAAHEVEDPGPIVHRDLKPANVMLQTRKSGELIVKVLDFGIAQLGARNTTRTGILMGTPAYMAPEQGFGATKEIGPPTDVFALGVMLAELLSLDAPSDDERAYWVRVAHGEDMRATLAGKRADAPASVWDVIVTALAREPRARYPHAGALRAAARPALEGFGPNPVASGGRGTEIVSGDKGATQPMDGPPPGASEPFVPRTNPMYGPPQALQPTAYGGPPPTQGAYGPAPYATQNTAARTVHGGGGSSALRIVITLLVLAGLGAIALAAYAIVIHPRDEKKTAVDFFDAGPPPSAAQDSAIGAPSPASCPDGMVKIEGGPFWMGTRDGDADEQPRQVAVKPFCLSPHEVTVKDYAKCVDKGLCPPVATTPTWPSNPIYNKQVSVLCTAPAMTALPINCVDVDSAEAYCKFAGGALPTEEQWEFAARGSKGRTYAWGEDPPSPGLVNACGPECIAGLTRRNITPFWAYTDDHSICDPLDIGQLNDEGRPYCGCDRGGYGVDATCGMKALYGASDRDEGLAEPGRYGANPEGISDLTGNVWEWTSSSWRDARVDAGEGGRVIRGGGFLTWNDKDLRASRRMGAARAARLVDLGFRCAKSLDP